MAPNETTHQTMHHTMHHTTHQATCVTIGDRAILIEGDTGSGKSSLALALIDRGAALIGDDGVLLMAEGERLIASAHPRTSGLIEVRNLGLLRFAVCDRARVVLVVALDADAPRHIEHAAITARCGITLPMVRMTPHEAILAVKVELALERFGLGAS